MRAVLIIVFAFWGALACAGDIAPRGGWVVLPSAKPFDTLVSDVRRAAKASKMGVVTQAGPTKAAKARGISIPGNRVIGLFNNRYAVRILGHSTAAMIEAPVRVYVTENADGTASLSYKTPSFVFEPYMPEADPDLRVAAEELDAIFMAIAQSAVQ